ncbi:hypothetical protein L596_030164 [Steinernema carpocapsae]|uniref:Uncharacterized protein n=1 Tax=Steinernema carpocapsae TaxID=34508 RepID=A0A4U5LRW9_STECR|nr:hypothetical protein L596_030164 [Steinernema carpocapsae]
MKALDHKQVRRVASFTCSPPKSTDKYNKRVADEKKTKPSITKKISAFFSKELTSSMSQLHHSQEDIRNIFPMCCFNDHCPSLSTPSKTQKHFYSS